MKIGMNERSPSLKPFRHCFRLGMALVMACMVTPAAQAFANGTAKVEIASNVAGKTVEGTIVNPTAAEISIALARGTPEMDCSGPAPGQGVCENELPSEAFGDGFHEAEIFKAIPDPGYEFVEWKAIEGKTYTELGGPGYCSAGSEPMSGNEEFFHARTCIVYNESSFGGTNQNIKVQAVLAAVPFELTVYTGGHGTVAAIPSGLLCETAEECEGEYPTGEKVTLTATADSGYAFAGWIGCQHSSTNACTLTMPPEAAEVTAVFVKQPENGKNVVVTEGASKCAAGGVTVEVEGEPNSKKEICQGEAGQAGAKGETGPEGKQGAVGPAGSAGSAGPAGPQGATGPAGPSGKIVCKATHKGKKIIVNCKLDQGKAQTATLGHGDRYAGVARVRWRLLLPQRGYSRVRHGSGVIGPALGLRLSLDHLRRGRYLLHVQGQRKGTMIVVG